MRVFDPLPPDHPLVRDKMACPLCDKVFAAGDVTTLVPRQGALVPGSWTVEAFAVHAACMPARTPQRAMERADFDAAADVMYRFASEAFADNPAFVPTMFVLRLDAEHKVHTIIPFEAGAFFRERFGIPGRELAARVLEQLSGTPATDIAALVAPAWVVLDEDNRAPLDPDDLADDPRRQEAVGVVLRTADFSTFTWYAVDQVNRKLQFQPLQWGKETIGRFAHRSSAPFN
jgi:hypothetical protein